MPFQTGPSPVEIEQQVQQAREALAHVEKAIATLTEVREEATTLNREIRNVREKYAQDQDCHVGRVIEYVILPALDFLLSNRVTEADAVITQAKEQHTQIKHFIEANTNLVRPVNLIFNKPSAG